MPDLFGSVTRDEMVAAIERNHYSRSVPSGKSHYFDHGAAVVVFSIPANPYIARWLLGYEPASVWELSRLWAPDCHERNLLTQAIARSIVRLRAIENVDALISYADPNVGHHGGVYRAASWSYLGPVEESRYYRDTHGTVIARRAFHSGDKHLVKSDIEAMGYTEEKMPGRHRYAHGLTPKARKAIQKRAGQVSSRDTVGTTDRAGGGSRAPLQTNADR